jgi:mycothiol synthase
MTSGLTIDTASSLTSAEATAVAALVAEAAGQDGFSALNEAAQLHLRHDRPGVLHVLARHGGELVGYAQLDADTPAAPDGPTATGQLVVHPDHRRAGAGSALLARLLSSSPAPLRVWAMGDTPAARALAASQRLVAARTLLIMTRPLSEPVPDTPPPPGTTIRTFVVGQDEDAWLRTNAVAFAHHPEQGQLTRSDLEDRMAEPWFDPTGFFLASRSVDGQPDAVVGFHWTKQHPDRLGEVYVLGVDPTAGGRGLGKSLLGRGLTHLRDRGNTTVQLYVEADHDRAVGLYTGYGFTVSSRDVMYAQP